MTALSMIQASLDFGIAPRSSDSYVIMVYVKTVQELGDLGVTHHTKAELESIFQALSSGKVSSYSVRLPFGTQFDFRRNGIQWVVRPVDVRPVWYQIEPGKARLFARAVSAFNRAYLEYGRNPKAGDRLTKALSVFDDFVGHVKKPGLVWENRWKLTSTHDQYGIYNASKHSGNHAEYYDVEDNNDPDWDRSRHTGTLSAASVAAYALRRLL